MPTNYDVEGRPRDRFSQFPIPPARDRQPASIFYNMESNGPIATTARLFLPVI
jgi:hypothetical protein